MIDWASVEIKQADDKSYFEAYDHLSGKGTKGNLDHIRRWVDSLLDEIEEESQN